MAKKQPPREETPPDLGIELMGNENEMANERLILEHVAEAYRSAWKRAPDERGRNLVTDKYRYAINKALDGMVEELNKEHEPVPENYGGYLSDTGFRHELLDSFWTLLEHELSHFQEVASIVYRNEKVHPRKMPESPLSETEGSTSLETLNELKAPEKPGDRTKLLSPRALEELRTRMKDALERSGLSLAEVGVRMGFPADRNPRGAVHKILRRSENPDLFLVLRFCRVVGADPAKIIPLDCDPMK
jgi:hypothetical protein